MRKDGFYWLLLTDMESPEIGHYTEGEWTLMGDVVIYSDSLLTVLSERLDPPPARPVS